MTGTILALGAATAVLAGLDRTAALQVMISRPLVVGPVIGWLLGAPQNGLLIGSLVELLWLARMPVGASIPPDDTQVAIGATCLSVALNSAGSYAYEPVALFCLMLAMPLGKVGQWFDHLARDRNGKLMTSAERALAAGQENRIEGFHLRGLVHFGLSSLACFGVIMGGGLVLGGLLFEPVVTLLLPLAQGVKLLFPLVGAAVILATLHVSRALTLFSTSFITVLLTIWLL